LEKDRKGDARLAVMEGEDSTQGVTTKLRLLNCPADLHAIGVWAVGKRGAFSGRSEGKIDSEITCLPSQAMATCMARLNKTRRGKSREQSKESVGGEKEEEA